MYRLREYFLSAKCCLPATRKIGIETETLLSNRRTGAPISFQISQDIMKSLVEDFKWIIEETKNDLIVQLQKNDFIIFYELGWNNFEISTPAYLLAEQDILVSKHTGVLEELGLAAGKFNAKIENRSWSGEKSNTLIIPDDRDRVWLKLDGEALFALGHIASSQVNIDLLSVEEGMDWIRKLKKAYLEWAWPPEDNFSIWNYYINNSYAKYELDRYAPPPDDFLLYCQKLSGYKVVMNKSVDNNLEITKNPLAFQKNPKVDINLFLRSVWWFFRLRVRNNKLVLEIRDIPRHLEAKEYLKKIRQILDL